MNDRKWNETDIAIKMAKRALDIPNADPDDDIRTISRQFLRSLELLNAESDKAIDSYHQRLKQAITSEPEPIEKWSVEEIIETGEIEEDLGNLIEQAPNMFKCLESALNDLDHLKTLALNGMPGEFTLGMCRRMDDYHNAIRKAKVVKYFNNSSI